MTTTTFKLQTSTRTPKKLKCASPATVDLASRNAQLKFPQGSKVEVKIDEEGFRGAWYGATVVEAMSPSSKKKRKTEDPKGHGLYLVQYDTLLAQEDDPTEPLRETVDVSSIRPAPPSDDEEKRVFRLYDVVDAFHRDGWWTGVVTRVGGENGGPKFAVFFSSPPEEIEFDRSDLRLHREWLDGKWNLWQSGAANQILEGSMFNVGTEVEVSLGEGKIGDVWFLAVLLGEIGNDYFVVECYNSGSSDEASQRRVNVDALHIRPCPPRSEYRSFTLGGKVDVFCGFGWSRGSIAKILKDARYTVLLDQSKEEKELSLEYLRPCMDWTDGKWIIASQEIVEPESGESSRKRKRGRRPKSMKKGPTDMEEKGAETASSEAIMEGDPETQAVRLSETGAVKSSNGLKTYLSKRELQRSMSDTEPLTPDTEDALRRKTSGVSEPVVSETPSHDSDNLPLWVWFGGKKPRSTVHKSGSSVNKTIKQCTNISGRGEENATKSPGIASEDHIVSEKNDNLPFEKCFPIWKTLERMEIFRTLPQKPHFQPLLEANESSREGLAIARMVNFANITEAASKFQIGDPKRVIESNLEALLDLEAHGFKVDPIRDRLNELLLKKEERGKLLKRLQELHAKIEECCLKRSKIDEEVQELKAKIKLAESAAGKIDIDVAAMKLEVDVINQDVQSSQRDFERLVAVPW